MGEPRSITTSSARRDVVVVKTLLAIDPLFPVCSESASLRALGFSFRLLYTLLVSLSFVVLFERKFLNYTYVSKPIGNTKNPVNAITKTTGNKIQCDWAISPERSPRIS